MLRSKRWNDPGTKKTFFFNEEGRFVDLEGNGPQTILFAIERIWLYIVKYNGYFYKKTGEYY